jgi:hypothetical protein
MLPIARGMKKLHARGWFHGDLEALNILVGKGRAMVTNEDNEASAEMISPYLFLSIIKGEYENYVGAEVHDFGGHQMCCKTSKKTPNIHTKDNYIVLRYEILTVLTAIEGMH